MHIYLSRLPKTDTMTLKLIQLPVGIETVEDFNAQKKQWYPLGEKTFEGTKIDGLTS